jgi:hypothetical protein
LTSFILYSNSTSCSFIISTASPATGSGTVLAYADASGTSAQADNPACSSPDGSSHDLSIITSGFGRWAQPLAAVVAVHARNAARWSCSKVALVVWVARIVLSAWLSALLWQCFRVACSLLGALLVLAEQRVQALVAPVAVHATLAAAAIMIAIWRAYDRLRAICARIARHLINAAGWGMSNLAMVWVVTRMACIVPGALLVLAEKTVQALVAAVAVHAMLAAAAIFIVIWRAYDRLRAICARIARLQERSRVGPVMGGAARLGGPWLAAAAGGAAAGGMAADAAACLENQGGRERD